jgi:hypothetical protein
MNIEPGSASRVPAGRFAAECTARRNAKRLPRWQYTGDKPVATHARLVCARVLFVSPKKEKPLWLA